MFIPDYYYHKTKISASQFTRKQTHLLSPKQIILGKPHWIKPHGTSQSKPKKTLIINDARENWEAENRVLLYEKLLELIKLGFKVYL